MALKRFLDVRDTHQKDVALKQGEFLRLVEENIDDLKGQSEDIDVIYEDYGKIRIKPITKYISEYYPEQIADFQNLGLYKQGVFLIDAKNLTIASNPLYDFQRGRIEEKLELHRDLFYQSVDELIDETKEWPFDYSESRRFVKLADYMEYRRALKRGGEDDDLNTPSFIVDGEKLSAMHPYIHIMSKLNDPVVSYKFLERVEDLRPLVVNKEGELNYPFTGEVFGRSESHTSTAMAAYALGLVSAESLSNSMNSHSHKGITLVDEVVEFLIGQGQEDQAKRLIKFYLDRGNENIKNNWRINSRTKEDDASSAENKENDPSLVFAKHFSLGEYVNPGVLDAAIEDPIKAINLFAEKPDEYKELVDYFLNKEYLSPLQANLVWSLTEKDNQALDVLHEIGVSPNINPSNASYSFLDSSEAFLITVKNKMPSFSNYLEENASKVLGQNIAGRDGVSTYTQIKKLKEVFDIPIHDIDVVAKLWNEVRFLKDKKELDEILKTEKKWLDSNGYDKRESALFFKNLTSLTQSDAASVVKRFVRHRLLDANDPDFIYNTLSYGNTATYLSVLNKTPSERFNMTTKRNLIAWWGVGCQNTRDLIYKKLDNFVLYNKKTDYFNHTIAPETHNFYSSKNDKVSGIDILQDLIEKGNPFQLTSPKTLFNMTNMAIVGEHQVNRFLDFLKEKHPASLVHNLNMMSEDYMGRFCKDLLDKTKSAETGYSYILEGISILLEANISQIQDLSFKGFTVQQSDNDPVTIDNELSALHFCFKYRYSPSARVVKDHVDSMIEMKRLNKIAEESEELSNRVELKQKRLKL